MSANLNATPSANRTHIALYGRRNAGKSSLINAITGQQIALVSSVAGTTTDPVSKAMEVPGLGPCIFWDTAGFDDVGELGELRVQKTLQTIEKADLALLVFSGELSELSLEIEWLEKLRTRKLPILAVINKTDQFPSELLAEQIRKQLNLEPFQVSAEQGDGIPELIRALSRALPAESGAETITGKLVQPGDVVLLVMPQDAEAPKGRLILPQVQTIRDLLDNRCIVIGTTPEQMPEALAALNRAPSLIITDSQVFMEVAALCPKDSRLTSFSVLFAAHKGDLKAFCAGAEAVDRLHPGSRVLIAEACTHAPVTEDIGREKIPALLRKKYGQNLHIEIVSGVDFPEDLSSYDLIVHCGGCMFNRSYLLSRIERAAAQQVPITNYGILLAKLKGILPQIELPI